MQCSGDNFVNEDDSLDVCYSSFFKIILLFGCQIIEFLAYFSKVVLYFVLLTM